MTVKKQNEERQEEAREHHARRATAHRPEERLPLDAHLDERVGADFS